VFCDLMNDTSGVSGYPAGIGIVIKIVFCSYFTSSIILNPCNFLFAGTCDKDDVGDFDFDLDLGITALLRQSTVFLTRLTNDIL